MANPCEQSFVPQDDSSISFVPQDVSCPKMIQMIQANQHVLKCEIFSWWVLYQTHGRFHRHQDYYLWVWDASVTGVYKEGLLKSAFDLWKEHRQRVQQTHSQDA